MSGLPPLRALIFDFDGVLADTEDLHWKAFTRVATALGLELSRQAYYAGHLGLPDRDCVAALCAQAGRPATAAGLDELVAQKRVHFAALAHEARLYPGVPPALRRLHDHFVLAIASGAFRDEIEPILARDGVRELFRAVVGAEDVSAGKPAPDPFLRALDGLRASDRSLAAAECLVLEDAPRGIEAARAAGMRCWAVTTSHSRAELAQADAVIAGVADLRPEDLRG